MKFILFLISCLTVKSYLTNYKKVISNLLIGSSIFLNPIDEAKPSMINSIDYLDKYENPKYTNSLEQDKTYITTSKNNIYFYGTVTGDSCRILGEKLTDLIKSHKNFKNDYNTDYPPINLHLQSPGGSLINTFYVLDIIIKSDVPIHTYVDGYVASAASLISVVGKKRYMSDNSMIMIHQLYSGNEGKYKELDDDMINLNTFMSMIKKIYLEHTKIVPNKLDDMLDHDLWLDSKKCLDYGLVDEII